MFYFAFFRLRSRETALCGSCNHNGRFTPYYMQQFAHIGFSWILGSLRRNVGKDGLNFAPMSPRGILVSEITEKFEKKRMISY